MGFKIEVRVVLAHFSLPPGLKEAQDKVNDYSPLMKDFPVNELLAAGSLEAIRGAVSAVYAHLRKIRTTSYPAQRAIYLVEAISRDLSTQLLKVCVCVCGSVCLIYNCTMLTSEAR